MEWHRCSRYIGSNLFTYYKQKKSQKKWKRSNGKKRYMYLLSHSPSVPIHMGVSRHTKHECIKLRKSGNFSFLMPGRVPKLRSGNGYSRQDKTQGAIHPCSRDCQHRVTVQGNSLTCQRLACWSHSINTSSHFLSL